MINEGISMAEQLLPSRVQRIPRDGRYSQETLLLALLFEEKHTGDIVTYEEMQHSTGMDMQIYNGRLQTARRLVRARTGRLFDCLPGVGLICLSEGGKLGRSSRRLQSTHKRLRDVGADLGTVDQSRLSPLERHRHLGLLSVTAIAAWATSEKTTHQLEGVPLHQQLSINPADYVHLFA
jgi:hypothetical protein